MDLPDFSVMTPDERRLYLQQRRERLNRQHKAIEEQVNCPSCFATAGSACRARSLRGKPRKMSPHKARYDAWVDSGKPGWNE